MRQIKDLLIVRVRVRRGHEAPLDPELVEQDLRERCQAVRGARGVRDDVVLGRVVVVPVDAEADRDIRIGRRGRNDDLAGTGLEVLRCALTTREEARRLEDDRDVELLPRQCGRIALGKHPNLLAVDRDAAVGHLNLMAETAEHGVVLEQVRKRLRIGQVVDGNDLDRGLAQVGGAEDVTADAAEAVNGNAGHGGCSLSEVVEGGSACEPVGSRLPGILGARAAMRARFLEALRQFHETPQPSGQRRARCT